MADAKGGTAPDPRKAASACPKFAIPGIRLRSRFNLDELERGRWDWKNWKTGSTKCGAVLADC